MKTRTISAIVAVLILAAIFFYWRGQGLVAITTLVGLGCVYEFSKLIFNRLEAAKHLRFVFLLFCAAVFGVTAFLEVSAFALFAVLAVFFFAMTVLGIEKTNELPTALQVAGGAATGFIYVGVFGGLVVRVLQLPDGIVWFFGLLAIVFAGDTLAYLTGRLFGRRKLLEAVSPKKTIEGSMGGLVGSALVGLLLGVCFLQHLPIQWLVLTALATGAFAQVGDLFESLVKRVAEVKDSGSIMPGHGGLLDRVDGVLFAAPIFYTLARFLVNA